MKIIAQRFFERDSHQVAHDLIGQVLCRQLGQKTLRYTLSEIEVYDGLDDRASHAFGKKPGAGRSQLMFGPAGIWYVYLCYGMHWMLNIVTRERGYPAALLIRGCREVSGPGRLTAALKITGAFNGRAAIPENKLWIERGHRTRHAVERTPRIGVAYAGPDWSLRPYRLIARD